MMDQWNCAGFLVAMATLIGNSMTTASPPCNGTPEVLTVDYTPKRIFSPGYPFHYDNNLHCDWLFETSVLQKPGLGIQLATLELELDAPYSLKAGRCNDSLEVFEGSPSSLGHSFGKWCGKKKHIIKALSENVTLRFLTNGYFVGKGFVIEYSLVRVASAECRPGRVTPVHVGRTPLYETFDVTNAEEKWLSFVDGDNCTWALEAIDELGNSDPDSALVVEAFSVPYVMCQIGSFTIFDGQDTSWRTVLEWCDNGQAFSKIYLSSNYATLTFEFKPGKKQTSKVEPIHLKLYTRNTTYGCNETHLPSINVGMDPMYFSLPLFKSSSGELCSVHVSQHVKNSLRLDVINVIGQEITCGTEAVIVRSGFKNEEVKKLCYKQQYPLYLPQSHEIIVSPRNKSARVYVRALTNDHFCGDEVEAQAYSNMIMEKNLPRDLDLTDVPHNCYLRYVIAAKNRNQTVSLDLQWNPSDPQKNTFTEMDFCEGDFISIYDGSNEAAPLLFSSCRKSDRPNDYVSARITGTDEKMLILYNTDSVNMAKLATLQYYSLPVNGGYCKKEHEVSVSRSIQYITSPNYPDFYPLDHICVYVLTAAEGNVIVVESVDTRFTSGCGDILDFNEGITWNPDKVYGRICGHDKMQKKLVSNTHKAILRFSSDKFGASGGWKLRIYSRRNNSGQIKATSILVFAVLSFFLCSKAAFNL